MDPPHKGSVTCISSCHDGIRFRWAQINFCGFSIFHDPPWRDTAYNTPTMEVECWSGLEPLHYIDVIMGELASQITSLTTFLLNHLFRRRSKETSKLCATGLCEGNSPVTSEFPAQRSSNAENVSILCRHYERTIKYEPCANFLECVICMNALSHHCFILLPADFKVSNNHDDVIKWKHFPRYGPLCGEFIGHRWIPRTKVSDAELWCFLWYWTVLKCSVNIRNAGDLKRHHAHYDVIVMIIEKLCYWSDNMESQSLNIFLRLQWTRCHRSGSLRLRWWLAAWRHQAITLTNVELWSNAFCCIHHLRAISRKVSMNLIRNMCWEITL